MQKTDKEPLFRKVNTHARGVRHRFGGDYRNERQSNAANLEDSTHKSMHGKIRRGLDYTPLFRFLLSKVDSSWDEVYSEAVSRIDKPDPIFWMVALEPHERKDYFLSGESTYYSGLYVDEKGRLQIVNPDLGPSSLTPFCACCTHTFNGSVFTQRFKMILKT
jgi:hypothetical protein